MPEAIRRVGRYDLLEVIGRGGAAVVYLARQRDLQRNVALKELAPYHVADNSFAARFVEESRLAGSMNHANVVTVHEFFDDGGVPYIAMEYLPYGSLRQYIGNLSIAQIAGVLEGVLAGLSHGESHGIVHRDLKPENLLVATDGRVKIADFGVARAYNQAVTREVVTVAGTTIGTPAYMSPEQALGAELTPATDLYSLGVVAWELLTGRVPFEESDTPVAVLYRHVHEPIPSVRTLAPDVGEGIAGWLDKILAKRPEDRFQSADAAWVELEDVVLELLGPRWRRDARLVLTDSLRSQDRPLTPAPFGAPESTPGEPDPRPGEPDPPSAARAPVSETVSDIEAPATVQPKRRIRASHTTMLRIPRRHAGARDGGEQAEPDPASARRRMIAAAIVAGMIIAAVAGVLVAQGNSQHRTAAAHRAAEARARAAAVAATAAANKTLLNAIRTLAVTRTREVTALRNAKTPHQQAVAAAAVRQAYSTAAKAVAPVLTRTPEAGGLQKSLTALATGYGKLARAANGDKQAAYASASRSIETGESTLQAQVKAL